MGRNHLRILKELESVELVAVADPSDAALSAAVKKYGAAAYTSYAAMLERERLDSVIVVVPTRFHMEVTLAALRHELHVLVEKPIAGTLEEARTMVQAARASDRILTVGHVERFNPAIQELKRRLDLGQLGRIFKLHSRRFGPFPARIRDVGVVIDLATHDLDVMTYLLGTGVLRLVAETEQRIHTEHEDMLNALLKFQNGTVGVLDVNWLTPTKVRDLSVLGERGMFHVDYVTQQLRFYENSIVEGNWDTLAVLSGVNEGNMTRYHINHVEPLRAELESFIAAAASGDRPVVSGQDGIRALGLALALVKSGRRGETIHFTSSDAALEVVAA